VIEQSPECHGQSPFLAWKSDFQAESSSALKAHSPTLGARLGVLWLSACELYSQATSIAFQHL
jgi:hypothetical protein